MLSTYTGINGDKIEVSEIKGVYTISHFDKNDVLVKEFNTKYDVIDILMTSNKDYYKDCLSFVVYTNGMGRDMYCFIKVFKEMSQRARFEGTFLTDIEKGIERILQYNKR